MPPTAVREVLESVKESKKPVWEKARQVFSPFRVLGERLKKTGARPNPGEQILDLYAQACTKAQSAQYEAALKDLQAATELAKTAQAEIDQRKQRIAGETAQDEAEQKEAFHFAIKVSDSGYGFDPDTDAQNFYLANSVDAEGGLKKSEKLLKMEAVLSKCIVRKQQMQAVGASIDEIVQTVFKHVPEAFWPDDVVKEVVLYRAVVAQIESEEGLQEAEDVLKEAAEKAEDVSGWIATAKSVNEALGSRFGESTEEFKKLSETIAVFGTAMSIGTDLVGAGFSGVSALDKGSNKADTETNPVQAKIDEFERNKAIVNCVNTLVSMGMSEGAELVPVLGAVVKGKDVLLEAAKAAYYFKNQLDLGRLEKGARVDPRSAAMLPLARLAREQRIAMTEAALKVVSNGLETAGKATELAHVAAPVGVGLTISGKAVNYGSKAVITGINWNDARNAANLIKQAAGPPPLRRAQIEVMKYASKYAKVAIVHLAMRENDPWAIGHLENAGLGREDLDHPATTSKLIREYMALKAGGVLGSPQGEDQLEDGTLTKLAKGAGGGIVKAAEWVRDKIVGRDTSIAYDSGWRATGADLRIEDWEVVRKQAIAAGWYDSRPQLEPVLTIYGEAQSAYNFSNDEALDKQVELTVQLIAALGEVKAAINNIKAVTNDGKTEHAGMREFCLNWYNLADRRLDIANQSKANLLDAKDFPGLEGEALESAKQEFMDRAIDQARKDQQLQVQKRRLAIEKLWHAHSIKTPWVTCVLSEFPQKVESGMFTFGATGAMDFHKSEVAELVVTVTELRDAVLERLHRELLASTTDDLASDFKASAMVVDRWVVEMLRTKCEDLYHRKMEAAGKSEKPLWNPKPDDFVLDWKRWRQVIDAAKQGGWEQEQNTGFTDALKAYQQAKESLEGELKKPAPDPTVVEQQRGRLMGTLDEYEKKLNAFKPVTRQKFHHPGLIIYRDGMLELCLAERVKFT